MHLRKLTLAIGLLSGALCANLAHGLGLGEITLKSALDEPLNAEIKLLQVRDLTSGEIIIGLASIDDFKRAGVDRVFFLQDIKFEVLLDNPGGPIVKVTSRKPVQEPYVNFLVQTRWPSGRLLREYTLLLDLPVFAGSKAKPVQPARAQTRPQAAPLPAPIRPSQSQQAEAPVTPAVRPAQPVAQAPRTPSTSSVAPSSDSYPVQANDTLWEIALRVRPNRDVSVQQTMVALQRINPSAFINDNINLLKKGQILKIPSQDEIENIRQTEAIGTVAYQNDQWSGGSSDSTGAQLEGSSASTTQETKKEAPRGQLTLAAPQDSDVAGQSSGSGDSSEQAALQNELSVNLEELDSTRRETDELNTRVGELDEQIDTIERLIDVSSEEMRALQMASEETTEAIDDAADAIDDELAGAYDESSEAVTDELVVDDELQTSAPVVEEPIVQEPVVEVPKVVQAPSQDKSFMDLIMDNLWYILGAIVALIAGAGFLMHRKAQAEMAAFDELDDDFYEDDGSQNYDESENIGDFDQDQQFDEDLDVAEADVELEEEDQAFVPTESETGDAVGEADIYIAYGKYDQAEEMLQRAIIADPNNISARVKLLEVYADTKDVEKFDTEYAQLMDQNDVSANRKAEELRSTIPNAGVFSLGAAAIAATTAAGAFSDDLSDSFESDGGSSIDFEESVLEQEDSSDFGEISLDLDLDGDSLDETLDESLVSAEETLDELATGEFELDLDEFESEISSSDLVGSDNDDLGEMDFTLDLDGSSDAEATLEAEDSDFTLDLEDSPASLDSDLSEDDDFLSDLEFTAGSQPAPSKSSEMSKPSATLDDAFDLDMDDMDLAALDEEMDALVGDLDDLDDLAPSSKGSAEKLSAEIADKVETSTEIDISESMTDLDELISLDDSSLDELSIDSGSLDLSDASVDALEYEENDFDDELGSELDFLADTDEVATKLDLARAYIDMGDKEGAKDILDEVVSEGNDEQKLEAQELIGRI